MWSHVISLSDLPPAKLLPSGDRDPNASIFVTLNTDVHDLDGIASRLMVPSVQSISADIELYRQMKQNSLIMLQATFTAQCHLQCGVSLEEFPVTMRDTLTQQFTTQEIIPTSEEDDVPEHITDGTLDIADVLLQLVAISIDPYPRKPNIELENVVPDTDTVNQPEQTRNPFAGLAELKDKL